jgi:hypothetical protein
LGDERQGRRPCSVRKFVTKSKKVETGYNLAESSNEGYGSKRAVLPVMMTFYEEFTVMPH